MYVLGAMYAILVGSATGWFFYNTYAGSKKVRLRTSILCGIAVAIISVLVAFGG